MPMAQAAVRARPARQVWADDLKVWLVVGVIAAHAVAAWTANEGWVLREPPVREPLLTLLSLASLVGVLFGMATFFLIAGAFTPPSLARKGPRQFVLDRLLRLESRCCSSSSSWLRSSNSPPTMPTGTAASRPSSRTSGSTQRRARPGSSRCSCCSPSVTRRSERSARPAERNWEGLTVRHLLGAIVAVGLVSASGSGSPSRSRASGTTSWIERSVIGGAGLAGWPRARRRGRRTRRFDRPRAHMSRWLFRVAWSAVTVVVLVVALMVGLLGYDVEEF